MSEISQVFDQVSYSLEEVVELLCVLEVVFLALKEVALEKSTVADNSTSYIFI